MKDALGNFIKYRHRYSYTFDGNDQLSDLNSSITDLTEENRQLRRRIVQLREGKQTAEDES